MFGRNKDAAAVAQSVTSSVNNIAKQRQKPMAVPKTDPAAISRNLTSSVNAIARQARKGKGDKS